MRGYCSNSPLRCEHARTLIVLSQTEGYCPTCGLALLPVQAFKRQLRTDEMCLRMAILMTGMVLLVMVYVYYAHFV